MNTDLPTLIQSIGYLGVWGMIFAESGLLIGFFLPGDSLLFTAGFLASQKLLNVWLIIVGSAFHLWKEKQRSPRKKFAGK